MENSAPSLKIFRTKFPTSALYNCGNKNRRQNPVWEFTKTIIPFALVGYEVIITNSRYALVGYFITSYPTRAHGIIVIYLRTWRARSMHDVACEFARAAVRSKDAQKQLVRTSLRRITLARGPIWEIHSLTLIISWLFANDWAFVWWS